MSFSQFSEFFLPTVNFPPVSSRNFNFHKRWLQVLLLCAPWSLLVPPSQTSPIPHRSCFSSLVLQSHQLLTAESFGLFLSGPSSFLLSMSRGIPLASRFLQVLYCFQVSAGPFFLPSPYRFFSSNPFFFSSCSQANSLPLYSGPHVSRLPLALYTYLYQSILVGPIPLQPSLDIFLP